MSSRLLVRSLPLSLDVDTQPTADTEDDRWSSYQPPVESARKAEVIEKHVLRSGWRSPRMSVRSIIGFGTMSVLLLVFHPDERLARLVRSIATRRPHTAGSLSSREVTPSSAHRFDGSAESEKP
jgi:hypothetical protein